MANRPSTDDWLLPSHNWRFQFVWPDGDDPDGNPVTNQGEWPIVDEQYGQGPTPNLGAWFDENLFKDIQSDEGLPGDKVFKDDWFDVIRLAMSGRVDYMNIRVKNIFKDAFKGKILPRRAIGINFIVSYSFNSARYPELEGCGIEIAVPVVGNHRGTLDVFKTVVIKA